MADPIDSRSNLDVLLVSQPVEYGVAVCVRQLVEAAVEAGHEVTVASPDGSKGPLAGWVEQGGARHVPVPLVRKPGVGDLRAILAVRRLVKGRDVVHLHSSKAGAVGRIAVATLRKRDRPVVVFTPHYWSWQVGGRMERIYTWIERTLAPFSNAMVAVSQQEADEGHRVLGARGDAIRVIPNGVDRKRFTPHGPRADRDETIPLLVCVGRLSEQKGQDVAIRALSQMEHKDTVLRLVGHENPPGEKATLEELAANLGVRDRIEWRGQVDDPSPEFRAADVVVAPSRWEGMSLVFLEGMACGAPMIVTDVFGSKAIGDSGIVIDPESPQQLARAADALLSDTERRQELGLAARERSKDFDIATTLARNLALWSELAETRAARRVGGTTGEPPTSKR